MPAGVPVQSGYSASLGAATNSGFILGQAELSVRDTARRYAGIVPTGATAIPTAVIAAGGTGMHGQWMRM